MDYERGDAVCDRDPKALTSDITARPARPTTDIAVSVRVFGSMSASADRRRSTSVAYR